MTLEIIVAYLIAPKLKISLVRDFIFAKKISAGDFSPTDTIKYF